MSNSLTPRNEILRNVDVAAEPYFFARGTEVTQTAANPASRLLRNGSLSVDASTLGAAAARPSPETPSEDFHRKQGYDEGYRIGMQEGRENAEREVKAKAELAVQRAVQSALKELEQSAEARVNEAVKHAQAASQAKLTLLQDLFRQASHQLEQRLSDAEEDMLALSFGVVCRIMGEQAVEPDGMRRLIRQAMEELGDSRPVVVGLHPSDLAVIREVGAVLPEHVPATEVTWTESKEVAMGGCILQTQHGGIDARLETQLGALRERLVHTRAARNAGRSDMNFVNALTCARPATEQGLPRP